MKKTLILISLLFVMGNIYAQSLNSDVIDKLQASFKKNQNDIALQNAISNNSLRDLAVNRNNADKQDHLFDVEIKSGSITSQHSSGRCWMFTSLNVFRPVVMDKLNVGDFEFSENYLYFWDILEKSNMFFERIIATADKDIYEREVYSLLNSPIGDGGAWNTFTNLVTKYGVVPKGVMPETKQSKSTSKMIGLIKQKLRQAALNIRTMVDENKSDNEIQKYKLDVLKDVYRILALSLGEPPAEFQWRYKDKDGNISDYKSYTPKSFWENIVQANVDDFVMFIDDPTRPYYKLYYRENDKNVYEGINWTFINIPTAELKPFVIESLKAREMMYFSCDVGKQFSRTDGTLDLNNYNYNVLYGVDFSMSRTQRMLVHQSGSTHGMALCGVDFDKNGNPTKWKLENSWGASSGNKGYLTMTDEWFNEYFFRLVIKKEYLSNKILKILKQEPIKVPFYNPAFSSDK
ncbi:MAG: C1 family peptidase [Bacteroidota bacterium]|nr:C1 family peptidase [Bacteroidota bacterium]